MLSSAVSSAKSVRKEQCPSSRQISSNGTYLATLEGSGLTRDRRPCVSMSTVPHAVVLLYLHHEESSKLVLVPALVGVIIQVRDDPLFVVRKLGVDSGYI